MKTRSIKTGLILIAIASVFALSSFTGATPKPEPEKIKTEIKTNERILTDEFPGMCIFLSASNINSFASF